MKNYSVKKSVIDFIPTAEFDSKNWENVSSIQIDSWPWHKEKYVHPKISVQCQYTDKYLYVRFHVKENFILAKYSKHQGSVWQDSCVEFFVSPDNLKYFNFEINCIGTILLCHGKNRHNRKAVDEANINCLKISTSLPRGKIIDEAVKCPYTGYVVEYAIPFSLFTKYSGIKTPSKDTIWKANFYKCGDMTPEPSWGSWSPVNTEQPDFHRPEFFGNIIFE